MHVTGSKRTLRKIAVAALLLSMVQWTQVGFVICFGSDGHVAIEAPAAKGCCKAETPAASPGLLAHFDFAHCVDIPLAGRKYIAPNRHTVPVRASAVPMCALPSHFFAVCGRHCGIPAARTLLPPPTPQSASLKTVVLLI